MLPEKLLTVQQAAERFEMSCRTLYRAINKGDLRAVKVGRMVRLEPTALEQWLDLGLKGQVHQ